MEVRMTILIGLMIPHFVHIHGQYYDPSVTFTFLVEGENIQYGNQMRYSRFDLILEIPYTPDLAQKMRQDVENVLKSWRVYPPFADATLLSNYLTLTQKGIRNLISGSQKQNQLFEYIKNPLNHTDQDLHPCKYTLPGLTVMELETSVFNIKRAWDKISTSWTAESIRATESQDNAIRLFAEIFDSELSLFEESISKTLSYIDSLASGMFPESLMGIYQLESCIGPMMHEEIIVKNCQGYNHSFVCRMEIRKPEALETAVLLIPVHYWNIRVMGESPEQLFVKTLLDANYKLLSCDPITTPHQDLPICSIITLYPPCEESLRLQDIYRSISECNFHHTIDYDPGILIKDGALLVQGTSVKVKTISGTETKFLTKTSPAKILSKKELQVETSGEIYIFPGMNGEVSEMVQTSALDQQAIAALVSKIFWKKFWDSLDLDDLVSWILIMIQVLFIPLTIGSFMGIKRLKKWSRYCVCLCVRKKKGAKYGKEHKRELVRLTTVPRPNKL
jgi:hypothetical protein